MDTEKVTLPLKITNIHQGKGERRHLIYGDLRDHRDTLLISALLPYILDRIPEILTRATSTNPAPDVVGGSPGAACGSIQTPPTTNT